MKRMISIEHDPEHLDYLVRVLSARPFCEVEPIIANIREGVAAHNKTVKAPQKTPARKS